MGQCIKSWRIQIRATTCSPSGRALGKPYVGGISSFLLISFLIPFTGIIFLCPYFSLPPIIVQHRRANKRKKVALGKRPRFGADTREISI